MNCVALSLALALAASPSAMPQPALRVGMIDTEGARTAGFIGSDFEKQVVAQTPLARTGRVGDIASIASFLASDDSAWLTGERLFASGGM